MTVVAALDIVRGWLRGSGRGQLSLGDARRAVFWRNRLAVVGLVFSGG